ncbi:hypothetical protein ACS0TY_026682 [Phlomoides rotata]
MTHFRDEEQGRGNGIDLVDNDYELEHESIDEDVVEGQGIVDKDIVEWQGNVDSNEDSGDEDLVQHGDDFDDRRGSDDETEENIYPRFNNEVVYNPEFEVGMLFGTKDEFKKAVNSHAVVTRRSLYIEKNDKIRVYAKCRGDGCSWGINALKVTDEDTFQIRKYKATHTCAPTFHVSTLKSRWLSEKYISNFQNDPKRGVVGWRKDVMKKLNVNISMQQAYRAKGKALEIIQGIPNFQNARLWDYSNELRNSNPNSTIVLNTELIDLGIYFQ